MSKIWEEHEIQKIIETKDDQVEKAILKLYNNRKIRPDDEELEIIAKYILNRIPLTKEQLQTARNTLLNKYILTLHNLANWTGDRPNKVTVQEVIDMVKKVYGKNTSDGKNWVTRFKQELNRKGVEYYIAKAKNKLWSGMVRDESKELAGGIAVYYRKDDQGDKHLPIGEGFKIIIL